MVYYKFLGLIEVRFLLTIITSSVMFWCNLPKANNIKKGNIIINREPFIEPWGTPYVTCLDWETVAL
jgi:hypothetical protein